MAATFEYDFDYVVVGSGFGGCGLGVPARREGLLGRRDRDGQALDAPKDFPKTTWNLRRWIWRPGLGLFGFYNMRPFKHVMILCGNAVGGGSITYANTMLVPPTTVWREGSWKGLAEWEARDAARTTRPRAGCSA